MKNKFVIVSIIIIVVAVGLSYFLIKTPAKAGKLDSFAQCLTDKGAIFYGAFWCSHCQNQKAIFGRSARLLNYVECSTPDARGQLSVCKEKEIQTYPTWVFSDGERKTGEQSLFILSEKTGCAIPIGG